LVVVGVRLTVEEIRQVVHEYGLVPHGSKGAWLDERGLRRDQVQRWRLVVFEGDLDRGLVPRKAAGAGGGVPVGQRTAVDRLMERERVAHEQKVARLQARVRELEVTNEVLGKAIGLLHQMSEQEPGVQEPGVHETTSQD
jgi:hypothetical protein